MTHSLADERKNYKIGMICVLGSMFLWGIMPIYWRSLIAIDSYVLILYRVVLAGIACGIIGLIVYGVEGLRAPARDKKVLGKMLLAGVLITVNWSVYVFAVNSGQTIEASIGYFMNPLVVCIFGATVFKEKLTKFKSTAIGFMVLGVIIMLLHFGSIPLVTLILPLSFATYSSIKKHLKIEAIISLFYETIFIAIAMLPVIIYLEITNQGALHVASTFELVLLSFAGIASALPLALFAFAANRIKLISIGIIGYIAPSISLLIGIFVFREPFDFVQFIACVAIWMGLAVFTFGEVKTARLKSTI